MLIRPKPLLLFAVICTTPLLVLSVFGFLTNLNTVRSLLRSDLQHELAATTNSFETLVREREHELLTLASSAPVLGYVRTHCNLENAPRSLSQSASQSALLSPTSISADAHEPPDYIKDAVVSLLLNQTSYSSIACFAPKARLLFVAERPSGNPGEPIVFRTRDFLLHEHEPDPRSWSAKRGEVVCGITRDASMGQTLRCATMLQAADEVADARCALVSDLRLDAILANAARRSELSDSPQNASGFSPLSTIVIVLDNLGEIVYHTNDALKHQLVNSSLPEFRSVAGPMMAGEAGARVYKSAEGDEWVAVYAPLQPAGFSLAIVRNYSAAASGTRRAGWISNALAVLLGLALATTLTVYDQRKTQSIERVTEGVAAIAKGELDLYIDARSRDDIRPLADSVNLMTERLRAQIAREAETRQFESFVKLSAMLTHDLKNAIGALSLLVHNMEEHFANEEFRADAMLSLTFATEKLHALVERISNPVTTLSGEFKRPGPIDLVPLVRRVLSERFGPTYGTHQVDTSLPTSLLALVDGERIEKVIENLVLNALEAMGGGDGKLTIEAGKCEDDKVYLSITDTGIGMSSLFIEERLFHAFATTKINGIGLGLYTCREVVRANGGTIEVTSKQGAGTTFRVVLPSPQSEEHG